MAEYIDKNRLILCMNDWMLQNAPVKAGDDTTRADTIMEAIKMVVDSPAADVRENVIRTQGDKLRAMSDEEMTNRACEHGMCPPPRYSGEYECLERKTCHDCWLDWLKSPVEVDNGGSD